jgi:hypothetical protein
VRNVGVNTLSNSLLVPWWGLKSALGQASCDVFHPIHVHHAHRSLSISSAHHVPHEQPKLGNLLGSFWLTWNSFFFRLICGESGKRCSLSVFSSKTPRTIVTGGSKSHGNSVWSHVTRVFLRVFCTLFCNRASQHLQHLQREMFCVTSRAIQSVLVSKIVSIFRRRGKARGIEDTFKVF